MDRWYWTASSLLPSEVLKYTCPCKRLYDGDNRTGFEDGSLSVTNLRLLWKHNSQTQALGLSLAIVVLVEEESGGFISSAKLVLHLSPSPPDQHSGPFSSSPYGHIKLAMKQNDLSLCMVQLQMALSDRVWESSHFRNKVLTTASPVSGPKPAAAGILGIERAMEAKHHATNQSISLAFEDLKKLMSQAKDMVAISHNIASRIKEQGHEAASDETTQFRSCLLNLGIDDPVTRDAVGSATEYHHKLAKEIALALEVPVREAGGVMLLSEVYCRINRARGLHLLSPEDLSNACALMSKLNLPLILHSFDSGVQTLQLSSIDTKTLVEEISQLLQKECGGREGFNGHWKGLSAGEMARLMGLPLLLAKERLLLCERNGAALRDESNEGLAFYPNYFDQVSS